MLCACLLLVRLRSELKKREACVTRSRVVMQAFFICRMAMFAAADSRADFAALSFRRLEARLPHDIPESSPSMSSRPLATGHLNHAAFELNRFLRVS